MQISVEIISILAEYLLERFVGYISHASEHKDEIARPLVDKLGKLGIKVSYDTCWVHWLAYTGPASASQTPILNTGPAPHHNCGLEICNRYYGYSYWLSSVLMQKSPAESVLALGSTISLKNNRSTREFIINDWQLFHVFLLTIMSNIIDTNNNYLL
jgi:hypothetical protein